MKGKCITLLFRCLDIECNNMMPYYQSKSTLYCRMNTQIKYRYATKLLLFDTYQYLRIMFETVCITCHTISPYSVFPLIIKTE